MEFVSSMLKNIFNNFNQGSSRSIVSTFILNLPFLSYASDFISQMFFKFASEDTKIQQVCNVMVKDFTLVDYQNYKAKIAKDFSEEDFKDDNKFINACIDKIELVFATETVALRQFIIKILKQAITDLESNFIDFSSFMEEFLTKCYNVKSIKNMIDDLNKDCTNKKRKLELDFEEDEEYE